MSKDLNPFKIATNTPQELAYISSIVGFDVSDPGFIKQSFGRCRGKRKNVQSIASPKEPHEIDAIWLNEQKDTAHE